MAAVVLVVAVLGVALLLFSWLGLRSVETSEAQDDYQRILQAQTSELQVEIQSHLDAMDGLASTLGAAPDKPSAAGLQLLIDEFDPLFEGEAVTGVAVLEITDRDLGSEPQVQRLLAAVASTDAALLVTSDEAFPVYSELAVPGSTSDQDGPLLVSPVRRVNGDGTTEAVIDSLLIGRLDPDRLLSTLSSVEAGAAAPLQLSVDQIPFAGTVGEGDPGDPFGLPVEFIEAGVVWSIQGYEAGVETDHRGSSVALIAGLVLAITGVLFWMSARRHAITVGRLERSEFDARHDLLTGLFNRAGLTEELERRLQDRLERRSVSVFFLDLDRLKVVNDSIGHSAGDEVLVGVAGRLEEILRGDDIVGRFGGDEFVLLASGLNSIGDMKLMADRILEAFSEPAVLSDGSSQVISGSIGIAFDLTGGATAESLLRDADLAMYRAKDMGGSCYEVFDAGLRAQALARLEVEQELRRAIRTGQLIVYYQPIVDVNTGMVDRLEALVRWQHPRRGIVAPKQFLSVAAESGLIVEVGEHVLREACRQVARWDSAVERKMVISVNVAERQLLDSELVSTVRRVLAETGVDPSQLELEITEELIVEKLDNRLSILRELDEMGIRLAIDDFGTSRASLSQLKRLDMVSTLKIDRAFVIDVATDSVDRKIITAIVALADSVGMEVVAEGVEQADQVSALRHLGVHLIQGFYFQRPAPTQSILGILERPFDVPESVG